MPQIGSRASCHSHTPTQKRTHSGYPLDANGSIVKFEMNDRCAAGTGRFLEVLATALSYSMAEFVHAGRATEACRSINAMCIVFAESEVISATARGVDRAELARGLHDAVVRRAVAMLRRLPLEDEIVFCGDGALNTCLHELVSRALNREVYLPPEPQIVAALGAALSVGPKHSVLKSGRPRCSPCLDRGT